MCADVSLFQGMSGPEEIRRIVLGDNSEIPVEGVGNVVISTSSCTLVLNGVLFAPNLSRNLMSVCKLNDENYDVMFK